MSSVEKAHRMAGAAVEAVGMDSALHMTSYPSKRVNVPVRCGGGVSGSRLSVSTSTSARNGVAPVTA